MSLWLFFVAGALLSWPMQRLILQLPADILETSIAVPTPPHPWGLTLVNGLLWSTCAWHWPNLPTALCWSLFASTLLTLSWIDWQTTLLPDALTQPLVWAGLLASATHTLTLPLDQAVWGAALGYVGLWSVARVFTLVTRKEGMGAGDFKLLAALGAWLGPMALLPLVFLASLVGAVLGLLMQARGQLRQGVYVPFGPFLAAAGMVLALTGDAFFLGLLTR
jgi:leader peptidase (prepilin peptidase)/N-methyltransferase